MKYEPGDIGLSWGRTRFWKGSLKASLQKLPRSIVGGGIQVISGTTHVVMVVEGGNRWTDCMVGEFSWPDGARIARAAAPRTLAVYRPRNLTYRELHCMEQTWQRWAEQGISYSVPRLGAHTIDWALSLGHLFGWRPATRLLKGGHDLGRECSNGVAAVTWRCARKEFGVHHDSSTPGQIWDFVRTEQHHRRIRARYRGKNED